MNNSSDFLEPIEGRRFGISWVGVLIGLIIGVGLGLFYTWEVDPVIVRNSDPADLSSADKQVFMLAIAQEYAADRDIQRAVTRLLEVEPDRNPFEVAAEMTCELIRSGQVDNSINFTAVQSLREIYESQGVSSQCEVAALNTPIPVTLVVPTATISPTPTITPVASKTPTAPFAPTPTFEATLPVVAPEEGTIFREQVFDTFCDPEISGRVEFYVRDVDGIDIPGVGIELSWENGQFSETFYTGLKPERGDGYADFVVTAGETYRYALVDRRIQQGRAIEAVPCDAEGTLYSYRIVLREFED